MPKLQRETSPLPLSGQAGEGSLAVERLSPAQVNLTAGDTESGCGSRTALVAMSSPRQLGWRGVGVEAYKRWRWRRGVRFRNALRTSSAALRTPVGAPGGRGGSSRGEARFSRSASTATANSAPNSRILALR